MADSGRKFLSIKRVMAMLDVSRRTVYRLVEQGRLAAPHRMTGNVTRWLACDVEAFINRVIQGDYEHEEESPPPEGEEGGPPDGSPPPTGPAPRRKK